MEFIIKKENEKFEYYHENVNIPYNKIGSKMLELSEIVSKKETKKTRVVLLITIILTIVLWSALSWWMIILLWVICFSIIGGDTKSEVAFRFEKSSDKKGFEKLNNLMGEINECAYKLKEEESYISYGIDGTFKIEPSVWYSKVGDDGVNAFFMPGFLFFNDGKAIDYANVEVANIDAYGFNYPLLNDVKKEQVIINTWRYTNRDGSKNKVRSDNHEFQIIKASKIEFIVNNSGEFKQYISFSNRKLANKIIEVFKVVFPDINYRENLIGERTDHQILAFLFILVAGGIDADVDDKEKKEIVNFVMKIAKLSEVESIKLVDKQYELYMELIVASVGFGVNGVWSQEIVVLLNALKNIYNQELCQEVYDVAKEIAFADGEVDEGEKAVLKSMKDILDASDAKGKSRVGAIEDLGKRDDFNDSEKKSSF